MSVYSTPRSLPPLEIRERSKEVFESLKRSHGPTIPSPDTCLKYVTPTAHGPKATRVLMVPRWETVIDEHQILMVLTPSETPDRWSLKLPGGVTAEKGDPRGFAFNQLLIQTGFETNYNSLVESYLHCGTNVYVLDTMTFRGRNESYESEHVMPVIFRIGEVTKLVAGNKMEPGPSLSVLRDYLKNREPRELEAAQLNADTVFL